MSQTGSRQWVRSHKKLGFALLATTGTLAASLFCAELAVRWYWLGGAAMAIESFLPSPHAFVTDPELGFKLNPERDGVNSLGILQGEISPRKPPGTFRVLVLGDSVAFDFDGFVRMLQEDFHRIRPGPVEVINASIPGYTTYQELVLLKRDLIHLQPDLVILQYCLNDNHRFLHYIDESGRWLMTAESMRAVGMDDSGALGLLTRSSYLLLAIRIGLAQWGGFSASPFVWERRPDFYAAWRDSTWPQIERYLAEMKSLLDSVGAEFAIVAVPFGPQLSEEALEADRAYTLKPQRRLAEISSRIGVPLLDLFPVFSRHRESDLYRDGIHLTEQGHRITADELLRFLRDCGMAASRGSHPEEGRGVRGLEGMPFQ